MANNLVARFEQLEKMTLQQLSELHALLISSIHMLKDHMVSEEAVLENQASDISYRLRELALLDHGDLYKKLSELNQALARMLVSQGEMNANLLRQTRTNRWLILGSFGLSMAIFLFVEVIIEQGRWG